MPETENKVQFNLKNVHYAILTDTSGLIAWGKPVHVPGAVSLTLDPQGEIKPFYADGMVYYQSVSNNGYSGDLEMARFPEKMVKDVWGAEESETDHVIIETALVEPKPIALLFQIDGDKAGQYYCMYNCLGTRPGIGGATNTETKEPQTQKISITASPLEDGRVMARTTSQTSEDVKKEWFNSVYEKAAA